MGTTALAFIACFFYVMLFSLPQVRSERDRARSAAEIAEAANGFLRDMLAAPDPHAIGRDVKVADVLDIAARRIETAYADRPLLEASLRGTLGNTYYTLGLLDKAERQIRRAVELFRDHHGEEHSVTINILNRLGTVLRE